MSKLCLLAIVLTVCIQGVSAFSSSEVQKYGAGVCTDYIDYDAPCGGGNGCENNNFADIDNLLCRALVGGATNARPVEDHGSPECETHDDENDDPCDISFSWANSDSGCSSTPCFMPF